MEKLDLAEIAGGALQEKAQAAIEEVAAMQNIKNYLEYELSEYKQFTVIS